MKTVNLLIFILAIFAMSCDEDLNPTADFEIIDSNKQTPLLTFEDFATKNNSQHGAKFLWQFGDGTSSSEIEPVIRYTTSGTYEIKLITESSDGLQQSTSKQIVVLDRVLKQITLTTLDLTGLNIPEIDNNSTVDVFISVNQFRTLEGALLDKVVYQSNMVNLSPKDLPYKFNVSERVVMNPSLINGDCLSFNIKVAIDGQTYTVGSNLYSGSSFGPWAITGSPLSFATTSVGGSFTLECEYK